MKLSRALFPVVCLLAGCASAPKPEPTSSATTLTAAAAPTATEAEAATEEASTETAAEQWAEKNMAGETDTAKPHADEALDPLATDAELEAASIPITHITPAKELRAKRPADLAAALRLVEAESSMEGAVQKLTKRLGKPSWTEAPQGAESAVRRIWVASSGGQCQRLVLEADGSVLLETASHSELRMLSATARQNPCTGAIERGLR